MSYPATWKPPFLQVSNGRMIFLGQYFETLLSPWPKGHPAEDGVGGAGSSQESESPCGTVPMDLEPGCSCGCYSPGWGLPGASPFSCQLSLVCPAWNHSTAGTRGGAAFSSQGSVRRQLLGIIIRNLATDHPAATAGLQQVGCSKGCS